MEKTEKLDSHTERIFLENRNVMNHIHTRVNVSQKEDKGSRNQTSMIGQENVDICKLSDVTGHHNQPKPKS